MNNPSTQLTTSIRFLVLMFAVCFAGCGTIDTKKDQAPKQQAALTTIDTKPYLPVRQYDKEGNWIPYVPQINPYLEMKGKIDKEAVFNFIAARKAIKAEKWAEAETLLQKIITIEPSLAGPWVLLGNIAEQKNDPEKAMEHYQKAISVNKLNVNAYLPLAKLQRIKGEFLKAQNTYAKALAVWKDFPEAHLNLGILYDIYLNDSLQAQQHMEAYQFLKGEENATVSQWLDEIRSRTGIEPNLYIGPSNTSQNSETQDDKSES